MKVIYLITDYLQASFAITAGWRSLLQPYRPPNCYSGSEDLYARLSFARIKYARELLSHHGAKI
jgi:hypothetical protein